MTFKLEWSRGEGEWTGSYKDRPQYVIVTPSTGNCYLYRTTPDSRGRTDMGHYDSLGRTQTVAQSDWASLIEGTPTISRTITCCRETV